MLRDISVFSFASWFVLWSVGLKNQTRSLLTILFLKRGLENVQLLSKQNEEASHKLGDWKTRISNFC